jgi:beta-glucosidase
MKRILFLAFLSVTLVAKAQVYKDTKAPVEARVADLLSRLTLQEKLDYINGVDWLFIRPIERLGIPAIKMTDGPVGARSFGKTTAYPASILSVATWDTSLIRQLGVAIGKDCRSRGIHILLGPAVNIYRAPMCGRNFEYMGEDPFLTSSMAVGYIQGLQSQGVVATIKHFAANNQEWDRNWVSSDIDERTLQEIYLPAFKAAVQKGNTGAVMSSYNPLNGTHTSHNNHLNNEILRTQWGFDGILMSDWGSVHDGIAAATGGLDLEMPGGEYMTAKNLLPAIEKGEINEELINEKVRRIFRVCFRYGFFDRPQIIESIPTDNPESAQMALDLARNGIVLLKNENNVLPLDLLKTKKIAVFGPNADTYNAGGGSSCTDSYHSVTFLEELKKVAKDVEINYINGIPGLSYLSAKSVFYTAPGSTTIGLNAEYFDNKELAGTPKATKVEQTVDHEWVQTPSIEGIGEDNFSIRWTGVIRPTHTANYKFTVSGDDGYRLLIDNKVVIDFWSDHGNLPKTTFLQLEAGKEYSVKLEYYEAGGGASIAFAWFDTQDENFNDAIKMASESDAAIVCVGFNKQTEGEGADRSFDLPENHDSLIQVIAKANPNTIVILNAGGNVNMLNWLPKVKGLIHAFYPGQEGGTALAEVVLGKINPSGKLPASFEKKWADNPAFNNYYDTDGDKRVQYKEGIFVGYRYYDTKKVEPMFPFGFGLSYTTFAYANLKVDLKQQKDKITATVSFDVTNTGQFDGAEVTQLYVSDVICPVERPVKELKGFSKVFLKKGETKKVTITLDEAAFSYFKTEANKFGFDAGDFEILIGGSSKDMKLKQMVKVN